MRARHRAPRRRPRKVGERGPRVGLIALSAAGLATATVAATLMTGFAGASETATSTGQNQSPATGRAGVPQPVRPATTWYSEWSSWGSSGTNCDPMALRWC
jgi:hypothetical protein